MGLKCPMCQQDVEGKSEAAARVRGWLYAEELRQFEERNGVVLEKDGSVKVVVKAAGEQ